MCTLQYVILCFQTILHSMTLLPLHKYNNAKRSIPAHPTLFNDAHCDLHPLTMVKMFAKFDEKVHNGLVSIMFTSLFLYMSIVTLNFDL